MNYLLTGTLVLLLLVAAWQDSKDYNIRNKLVIPGAIIGVLINTFIPDAQCFFGALAGWILGLLLFLPFYLFRLMGAGDVKLMAMVGAYLGPEAVIIDIFYVIVTGGVLSIIVAYWRGVLKESFSNVLGIVHELILNLFISKTSHQSFKLASSNNTINNTAKLPYGVAIAVGTLVYLVVNAAGYSNSFL